MDNSNFSVRPRRATDLPQLAEVLRKVHALDGYPVEGVADAESWLQSTNELAAWVATRGGEPVGQIMVARPQDDDAAPAMFSGRHPNEGVAVLGRLFVSPDARGNSLAEHLMKAAKIYADTQGLVLVLDVMLKDKAAIHLYERLGWVSLGEVEHVHSGGIVEPARAYYWPRISQDVSQSASGWIVNCFEQDIDQIREGMALSEEEIRELPLITE